MNKQDELRMRLDLIIPLKWMNDFSTQNGDKTDILSSVVESNPKWVEEVIEGDYKLSDVLHDFKGIYAEDEHFLPRISTEDILGDFDENGDAVDVKEHTFDEVWDNIIEYGIATEDELRLVCHINGNKIESLNDVLEVRTPYKDWSQYKSMEG
tara:strand:- start:270 stop:728 length:459 start_codon:yes stop_codon:yes gene_type:complete